MFTRNDLVDAIVSHLTAGVSRAAPAKEPAAAVSHNRLSPAGPKGRRFLSEFDIKRRLTSDGLTGKRPRLTLAPDEIVSPLAVDWLVLKGVEIVRE